MKTTLLKPRSLGVWWILLLSLSCATTPAPAAIETEPELPAEVTINKYAGHGDLLVVPLRLDSGPALPFVVDTGSMATIVDKSLEPQLGKRLDTAILWNFGVKHKSGVYATPKLHLGNVLLRTGDNVWSADLKRMTAHSASRVMGILGMDCLRYYCIQLDFEAGKMRFLNPGQVNAAQLGEAFPMPLSSIGSNEGDNIRPVINFGSLMGGKGTNLMVDTGCEVDGLLESGLFRREMLEQRVRADGDVVGGQGSGYLWLHKCVWNGATYTNLFIGSGGTDFATGNGGNLIGLGFLARHLVTFDFPTRNLYLKQTRIGPLPDDNLEAAMAFLSNLKGNHKLPGWSDSDKGTIYCHAHANFAIVDGRKYGDPSTYHYGLVRKSKDSPWKLEKAWRTDQKDRTIGKYRVP